MNLPNMNLPNMNLLRHREDVRTLIWVAITHVLCFGGFFLFPVMPGWCVGIWVVAACWFAFLTAVITHNTVHYPIFRSRRLNKAFQVVLTLGYGSPVSAFVPGHNLSHHTHTQSRRDVMRTTKMRFSWNLLNQMFGALVLGRDIFFADMSYAMAMRAERPRWFRQWVLEWTVFLAVQLVLLMINPIAYVFMQFIPHIAAATGIIGINFLQHDGCDPDSEWNHTRNLVGAWINWWAFNNGYHTVHHMKPWLHWTMLPQAHAEFVQPHIHPNLNEPDILAYLWRSCIWPGKRVDYLGNPLVLPEKAPDESWLPGRAETPANVSMGAEADPA
ncbi:MAG: fatty acid desaturase [Myxococcota bacterium]